MTTRHEFQQLLDSDYTTATGKKEINERLHKAQLDRADREYFYKYFTENRSEEGSESSPYGVYIYATDGSLVKREEWATAGKEAVGVAVIDGTFKFVLHPNQSSEGYQVKRSSVTIPNNMPESDGFILRTETGLENTNILVATDDYTTNFPAVSWARDTAVWSSINGLDTTGIATVNISAKKIGSLPSVGEVLRLLIHQQEIDACLSEIGGDIISSTAIDTSSVVYDDNAFYSWNDGGSHHRGPCAFFLASGGESRYVRSVASLLI